MGRLSFPTICKAINHHSSSSLPMAPSGATHIVPTKNVAQVSGFVVPPQSLSAPSDEHFPMSDTATSYDSLASYILALPRTHRRLLCKYEQKCTDVQLRRAFRSHRRLEIDIDGGLHATSGMFGWKMLDNRKLVLYQGSGPVDGPLNSAKSTQCEIGGLFATPMLLLTVIAKY